MIAAHDFLRTNTRDKHASVDTAFARFDLTEVHSYSAFLIAHARAVVPIEATLHNSGSLLPPWRSRLGYLADDLRTLDVKLPPAPAILIADVAGELAGMLYVIEGSRLGGGMLAMRVGAGLPVTYLSAVHQQGEWRALLSALDARAANEPPEWLGGALAGARRAFDLFAEAARG